MADRTFSAEDLIRIYQENLTDDEQDIVDEFFMQEPVEETSFEFLRNLLEILERLFTIFSGARITALALTFGVFTSSLLNEAVGLLRNSTEALGSIIDTGGVDA